jgi:hypothetical protein
LCKAAGAGNSDRGCGFSRSQAQGPAQCILVILGQSRAQKGAALLESASVTRRAERMIRDHVFQNSGLNWCNVGDYRLRTCSDDV